MCKVGLIPGGEGQLNPTLAATPGADTLSQQNYITTTHKYTGGRTYLTLVKFTGGGYHTRVNYNNLC